MFTRIKNCLNRENAAFHTRSLRRRLTNTNVTIISNNCIAGVMYHDLGLRFNSPTINLAIKGEDYLNFCRDLEYYLNCTLEEAERTTYPVGILKACDDAHKDVQLNFIHYKSFMEAKQKWEERKKRVRMDNIYYIWEFYDDCYDTELLEEWLELPMKHKAALTHKNFPEYKDTFYVDCYKGREDTGKILKYRGISGKRYLDSFDYVAFLNEE